MTLQDKYKELIEFAQQKGVTNLEVKAENNVLYIDGHASSQVIKNKIWEIYNNIDPDFRAGDLILNIVAPEVSANEYIVQKGDNLTRIGEHFGLSWQEVYNANKDIIKNPDLIQPGWKLKIPAKV